jgi:hypothetical protein
VPLTENAPTPGAPVWKCITQCIELSQRPFGKPICLQSIERIKDEHHGPVRAVSIRIYSSTGLVAPTHNGVGQCGGPSILLLGEPRGTTPR